MPTARMNGVELYYQVKGRGIPIVFIHPPLLTSAVFAYQQVQLSGDFQIITFDIRGHGRSEASKAAVTYSLIVEDIKQLLDHLKLSQAYLCGYSTGGAIALEMMLTYPDRVAGAVVLGAMSEVSTWSLRAELWLARMFAGSRPLMGVLQRAISWGNADMPLTYRNLLKDAKKGNRRNIRQYYIAGRLYDCTKRLPRIRRPVLLIYGEKDRRFRKYARILKQGLPLSDLLKVPGVKHQLPTKAANALTAMIREWIREQEGTLDAWGRSGRRWREAAEVGAASGTAEASSGADTGPRDVPIPAAADAAPAAEAPLERQ